MTVDGRDRSRSDGAGRRRDGIERSGTSAIPGVSGGGPSTSVDSPYPSPPVSCPGCRDGSGLDRLLGHRRTVSGSASCTPSVVCSRLDPHSPRFRRLPFELLLTHCPTPIPTYTATSPHKPYWVVETKPYCPHPSRFQFLVVGSGDFLRP